MSGQSGYEIRAPKFACPPNLGPTHAALSHEWDPDGLGVPSNHLPGKNAPPYCTIFPSALEAGVVPLGAVVTCQPLLVFVRVALAGCGPARSAARLGNAFLVSGALAQAGASEMLA